MSFLMCQFRGNDDTRHESDNAGGVSMSGVPGDTIPASYLAWGDQVWENSRECFPARMCMEKGPSWGQWEKL
jgi:hypothetical protein